MSENQNFCGCSEQMLEEFGRRRQLSKWSKSHLRWFVADRLPGLSAGQFVASLRMAFNAWQKVCGLSFEETKTHKNADIIVLSRQIDGANGTLAEAQLPNGGNQQLRQWYDLGDSWDVLRPPQQGKIYLPAVATHETGHTIGLGHDGRSSGQLMAPFYSPDLWEPQQNDIRRAQQLYGPPKLMPPDPDPMPEPAESRLYVETTGGKYYVPLMEVADDVQ